jgi:hypothetical protein
MAGELVVEVRVEERMAGWRPLWQAVAAGPHLVVTGAVSVLSLLVMVLIAGVVLVTGRVPARLAAFQVMTLRERVRCYSYWFALRTGHPPFDLALRADDRADDPMVRVDATPVRTVRRRDVFRRLLLLGHLVALVPIGVVMDACYPLWIALAAVNGGWPPAFRRFLVAVEQWVVAVAGYGLFVTDTPPAFGLAAYGYRLDAAPTTGASGTA